MLELLQIFLDNIAPILLIAGIGYLLGRQLGVEPKPVSKIIFNVLSPALVFHSLFTSDLQGDEFLSLYSATILLLVSLAIIAYLVTRLQGANPLERAGVMLACLTINAGNFGLSVVDFAFGAEALSRAVVVFVAGATVAYTLGVFVASNGKASPKQSLRNIAKTPVVYATILALLLRGLDAELAPVLDRSIRLVRDAAIPMMILLLGLQLGQVAQGVKLRPIATGVGIKLLLAPIIAILFSEIFGFDGQTRIAFILQASMPTAILTIILATEFDLKRELSLNLILATTLLSPITLTVIIWWLQQTA